MSINQSEVGWCKRPAPYLNSSKAAQATHTHTQTLTLPFGTSSQKKTSSPELTQLSSTAQLLDSTKAVLLQHTTLGRTEFTFSVVSKRIKAFCCKLYLLSIIINCKVRQEEPEDE